jgi:hypothetical protein
MTDDCLLTAKITQGQFRKIIQLPGITWSRKAADAIYDNLYAVGEVIVADPEWIASEFKQVNADEFLKIIGIADVDMDREKKKYFRDSVGYILSKTDDINQKWISYHIVAVFYDDSVLLKGAKNLLTSNLGCSNP